MIFCIITALILGFFVISLLENKNYDRENWNNAFVGEPQAVAALQEVSTDATPVLAGTYIESIADVNMSGGTYDVSFLVWFRWDNDDSIDMIHNVHLYNSLIKKEMILKDYKEGNTHYQLARVIATVSKKYWTKCFPLEAHQMHFYIEPSYTGKRVKLIADTENSSVNRNIHVTGFKLVQHGVASIPYLYKNTRADVRLAEDNINVSSELFTAVEIERDGIGLYMKCFIALFGCLIWALIVLYINIYHRVDPLGMLPASLFGTVANIMVGASLLPAALEMGLLEYVNIWGILTILATAVVIINVNEIRRKEKKLIEKGQDVYFSAIYGRIMFYVVTFFVIIGNILLPLTAILR
jgi:hypothetical protein